MTEPYSSSFDGKYQYKAGGEMPSSSATALRLVPAYPLARNICRATCMTRSRPTVSRPARVLRSRLGAPLMTPFLAAAIDGPHYACLPWLGAAMLHGRFSMHVAPVLL